MRLIKIFFVIAILALLALAAAGVVYVQNNRDQAGVYIDKKELKAETHKIIDNTRKAGSEELQRMGKELHKAGENMKEKQKGHAASNSSVESEMTRGNRQTDQTLKPATTKEDKSPIDQADRGKPVSNE